MEHVFIVENVAVDQAVRIPQFATFRLRVLNHRAAYKNMLLGRECTVPARPKKMVLRAKVGHELQQALETKNDAMNDVEETSCDTSSDLD